MPRQQRLQPRPFRITEVMPPQPFLIHGAIQAETTYKIYGTRPKRLPWGLGWISLNDGPGFALEVARYLEMTGAG